MPSYTTTLMVDDGCCLLTKNELSVVSGHWFDLTDVCVYCEMNIEVYPLNSFAF